MQKTRRLTIPSLFFFLLIFGTTEPLLGTGNPTDPQNSQVERRDNKQTESTILFEDSMLDDWQEKWFLDGQKATLEHRNEGLYFSGGTITKSEDPEKYHAHHAVLWTKQVFEGDLLISYEMTRIDTSDYGNTLLYIQAQGIGIERRS